MINESSMSRIYKKLTDDSSCAIISTYRGERSEQENRKLLNDLKNIARSKYGFIEFISRWSEDIGGEVVSSDERSLLIPNITFSEALRLAQKYDQASFIYKDKDCCKEYCSNDFKDYDGKYFSVGDTVRTFNTNKDDKNILNLTDAREIFERRKGGPASYLVKGSGQKAFHLEEVLEVEGARASYFQKGNSTICIYHC